MPTPPHTSRDAIVSAGRRLLESEGLPGLTMQRVAAAVGVRAPSLYKRVRDRDALIGLVADSIATDLAAILEAAASTGDAHADLVALLRAFRGFARANPGAYGLLFMRLPDPARVSGEANARAIAPLFRTIERLGYRDALPSARTLVAWAHGFLSMELGGSFRLEGDVDEAFAFGLDCIVAGLDAGGDAARTIRPPSQSPQPGTVRRPAQS